MSTMTLSRRSLRYLFLALLLFGIGTTACFGKSATDPGYDGCETGAETC